MTSSATVSVQNRLDPRLAELEAEAVDIIRQTAGQFGHPTLLFSGGKNSVVVLELVKHAFAPAGAPLELLHADTGHNFPEVIEFRDKIAAQPDIRLYVAKIQDWISSGVLTECADDIRSPLQTVPLVETIASRGYDAVLGGARRGEEKARTKERVFSVRDSFGGWDPRRQCPELWGLYNGRHAAGENVRASPISSWTEADVWAYIEVRDIRLPPIYFAHEREVFNRGGMWLAPGEWGGPRDGETLEVRTVHCRTAGDMSYIGVVESTATTITKVMEELHTSKLTECGATRADDKLSESSMENRKKEGCF